jgi:hypothetical protein
MSIDGYAIHPHRANLAHLFHLLSDSDNRTRSAFIKDDGG